MPAKQRVRLRQWIRTLNGRASGQLLLTNMLFAFRTQRPNQQTLCDLFAAIVAQWSEKSGDAADAIVEAIADKELLKSLLVEPVVHAQQCSRVTDAVGLATHNIEHHRLCFGVRSEVPAGLLKRMEAGLPEWATKNEIRGRRPFAWVTQTKYIDDLRRPGIPPDDLATTVRDRLGLSHYGRDELLIEVQYPADVLLALDLVAPTFLEGGAGIIFRARFGADAWGRAVDLESLGDGFPEAVHRPIPFTSKFRILRIGRPKTAPGFEFVKVAAGGEHRWADSHSDFDAFVNAWATR